MNLKPLGRTRKAPHQLTSCSLLSPWSFELDSDGSLGCWCYAVCWFSLIVLVTSQALAKALVRKSHNPLAVVLSSAKTMRQDHHFKVAHGVMLEDQDPSGQCFIAFTPASSAEICSYLSHFLPLGCYLLLSYAQSSNHKQIIWTFTEPIINKNTVFFVLYVAVKYILQ